MVNTSIIASRCHGVEFEKIYSDYRMPDMNIDSPVSELRSRCLKNEFKQRYIARKSSEEQSEYIKRLTRTFDEN